MSKTSTSLTQVYDSGSLLETISASELPDLFNSDGISANKDKRSDNKGPEPEGVVSGVTRSSCQAGTGMHQFVA